MKTLYFAAAIFLLTSQLAAAQSVTVRGVVVDRSTGAGVAGVSIEVLQKKRVAITDTSGHFALPKLTEGPAILEVRRLGYEAIFLAYEIEADMPLLRIEIKPNPVTMQAIEVVADRFKSRRGTAALSMQVHTVDQLMAGPGIDLYDFLRARAWLSRCPPPSAFDRVQGGMMLGWGETCARVRGGWVLPKICVDGMSWFAGVESLQGWNKADIYRVEIIQRGSIIEIFTLSYMDRLSRGKVRLSRMVPSC